MDLIHNSAFRILKELNPSTPYRPGIYRVILDEPQINKVVAVLIHPEDERALNRGGRKRIEETKKKRKKSPAPLVGDLIWMDRGQLFELESARVLKVIEIETRVGVTVANLSAGDAINFETRKIAMASFLDLKKLEEQILVHEGLGGLVRSAMVTESITGGVSCAYVYKQWSNLCRFGIDENSLLPRRDRSGAPGVRRPCDSGPGARKKAGRKTLRQRVALAFGSELTPEQPGISSDWAAAIRAADKTIDEPKPSWPKRCNLILSSGFCGRAKIEDGTLELVKPEQGTYPNNRQIQRVLTVDKTRLELILEKTTKAHFNSALRGLLARNWKGVAGPNHTWAIDSTVGDIYLRSSVNRAWVVGRPIVYIIVDIWSTAVVGFYVCLCGPSWNTAKVSLFNAASDPALIGDLWGYQPIFSLQPRPTMCYALMCDRGEYLSQGHRTTAIKFLPLTHYAPPYRGDMKGLVEVLHRIEKDAQFLFVPGAMDYRRAELELRRVNPDDCVFTVREYVQYLYELFTDYNLTADRRHRVDAHMLGAGVFPSPAGLWRYGHEMNIAFRRHIPEADLVTGLLPSSTGHVGRDSVRHGACDYSSEEVRNQHWTAIARNIKGWDVPVNYYPGSMSRIWTPNADGTSLMRLNLSDESRASPEVTCEEWADALALDTMRRSDVAHQNTMNSLDALERMKGLIASAKRQTAEALAKATGSAPTMTEARVLEVAATSDPQKSEAKTIERVRDEAMDTYMETMKALLGSPNYEGKNHASG